MFDCLAASRTCVAAQGLTTGACAAWYQAKANIGDRIDGAGQSDTVQDRPVSTIYREAPADCLAPGGWLQKRLEWGESIGHPSGASHDGPEQARACKMDWTRCGARCPQTEGQAVRRVVNGLRFKRACSCRKAKTVQRSGGRTAGLRGRCGGVPRLKG